MNIRFPPLPCQHFPTAQQRRHSAALQVSCSTRAPEAAGASRGLVERNCQRAVDRRRIGALGAEADDVQPRLQQSTVMRPVDPEPIGDGDDCDVRAAVCVVISIRIGHPDPGEGALAGELAEVPADLGTSPVHCPDNGPGALGEQRAKAPTL